MQKKAEIDAMLARLQALSDDHFGYSPDEITWSHAGTPRHYAELLKRITDQRLQRGRARRIAAPISRPRPARLPPPGLGLVGEQWCSPPDGDPPMTKLSDTQLVILSAAAQRDDGAVLPLPETLKLKGGALDKVLDSLKAKGLIDHQGAPRGDDPPPLRITRAGLEAIGVETEDDAPEPARRRATRARRRPRPDAQATDAAAPATEADAAATPAKGKAKAKAAKRRAGQGCGRPRSPRRAPAPSRPR